MEEKKKSLDGKLIAAIVLIAAGALLMLNTFNLVDFSLKYYIINWRTLLIGIGLILLASPNHRITSYIVIGLGVVVWVPELLGAHIRLHQVFWPVILIAIGLIIISRRGKHGGVGSQKIRNEDGTVSTDYLNDIAIFGGGLMRVESQNFKGGTLTAIFGGREINLRTAQIAPEGCVIDVFAMFGGTKLIVPDDWQVKSDVLSLFGGFSDKRHIRPDEVKENKILLLKGVVMFGGVEVKSF